jgi:hypothetical protein
MSPKRRQAGVGPRPWRTKRLSASSPWSMVAEIMGEPEATLVDLIDSLLEKGVVLDGELVLGLADIDLIYVRLAALLVAADRLLAPVEDDKPRRRRRKRR